MIRTGFSCIAAVALLVGGCGRDDATPDEAAANRAAAAADPGADAAPPAAPAAGEEFAVTADPGAIHRLIEWRELPNGRREAVTSRDGPTRGSFARRETQFARREIDCAAATYRFVGEGRTLEEARRSSAEPAAMAPPIRDSISKHVVDLVCSKPVGSGRRS